MITNSHLFSKEICLRMSLSSSLENFMQRECRRCKITKNITSFHVDKRREDGRTLTCRKCYENNHIGKNFKTKEDLERRSQKMRGRKHTIEWRLAISKGHLKAASEGRNHFIKDKPSDPDNFRMRLEYQLWREAIIKLKGCLCELCGSDKRIHIHHIKCFYEFPELRTDINNGQVLCQSCHMKLTWAEKRKSGLRIHVNCKCPQHQNKGDI